MEALRKGKDTPFDTVDEIGADLLEEYPNPKDHGQIYYQLAHVYAQSGQARPNQTITYAKKALACPLDPDQKMRLYVYWGDAVRLGNEKSFSKTRKDAALVYLKGLAELTKLKSRENPPPDPGPPEIDVLPTDPRFLELFLKHQEQRNAVRPSRAEKNIRTHQDVLTRQLIDIYSRPPFATEELEALAEQVLRDESNVKQLMDQTRIGVAKGKATIPKEVIDAAEKEAERENPASGPYLLLLVLALLGSLLFLVPFGYRRLKKKPKTSTGASNSPPRGSHNRPLLKLARKPGKPAG